MHCQRDTLIKYLLDELYTYEEDHCDALNPFDSLHSVARQAGEQGEVNPMCSFELQSRLEEMQVQNEEYQRRMEERYQTHFMQQRTMSTTYRFKFRAVTISHSVRNMFQLTGTIHIKH